MKKLPLSLFPLLLLSAFAGLEPGDKIQLTIRGLPADEQQKISGAYRIGDAGTVRLPMLDAPLGARGLEPEQFHSGWNKKARSSTDGKATNPA